jgi:hypothetical protein
MSTGFKHIALANRNQATLEYLLLDAPRCSEWIAAVAFYKSLHVVEAIFARESPAPDKKPVRPVHESQIEPILPFVSPR